MGTQYQHVGVINPQLGSPPVQSSRHMLIKRNALEAAGDIVGSYTPVLALLLASDGPYVLPPIVQGVEVDVIDLSVRTAQAQQEAT